MSLDREIRMPSRRSKPRFSQSITIRLMAAAIAAIVLLGLWWIKSEYAAFQADSAEMEKKYFKSQQDLLKTEVGKIRSYIDYQRNRLEPRLRREIRSRVYEAHAIASNLVRQYSATQSLHEIQHMVKESLRPIRFNHGRGYYFAFNLLGIEQLFADRPEMEGEDMLPVQGANGEFVVSDMLDIVKRHGEGFYKYTWTKPNRDGHFPKIAYVKSFAPFGWVIGTGEYLDDVEKDIQQKVIAFIEQFRFGEDGYVFAGRWDGLSLCGPEKGKNMWAVTDDRGTHIVQEMIRIARQGDGFLTYVMPKMDEKRHAPKLSYVLGVPQWQWYIGTGICVDEIETAIARRRLEVKQQISHFLFQMGAVLTGLIVFVSLVAFASFKKTRKNLEAFSGFFAKAGKELVEIDPDEMDFVELQDLAKAANEMVQARKGGEAALRDSEARYRHIVENAPIGIFQRPLGGPFAYANPGILKQFKCDSMETFLAYYSKSSKRWVDPAKYEEFKALLLRDRKCNGYEMETRLISGETIWASLYAFLDSSGTIVNGFSLDITDRKQAELERERLQAQLLQAQKMESIGRLAGGAAHDFNNMLSVILGYSELAMRQLDSNHPVYTQLMEIAKAGRKSANLTQQLLAFARKQAISPKMLDLNETIEGMLKMLRRLIGEDIDLTWLPETKLWQVKMDQSQIDQILVNLCVNARDAINGVGKVAIATRNNVLDEAFCAGQPDCSSGEYACLIVSDDGCGMDAATKEKIFEPFFTTKGISKGTGLGLATVYGIVKQNNGFINVSSEPGRGTEFSIYLPRYSGHEAPLEAPDIPGHQHTGQGTVLLVEDEVAILDFVKTMLESMGYTVLAANVPDDAVKMIESYSGEVHLMLSDVIMPQMNGLELAQRIHSKRPSVKCLFMSGYMANVMADRGILNHGLHMITKPFTMNDLAAKIGEVLGN